MSHFLDQRDFAVFPVSGHFPYSKDFAVFPVSRHFPYTKDFAVFPVSRHFWKVFGNRKNDQIPWRNHYCKGILSFLLFLDTFWILYFWIYFWSGLMDNDLLFPLMCNIGAAMLKWAKYGSFWRIRLQRDDCGVYAQDCGDYARRWKKSQ